MAVERFLTLGMTALKSNFTTLDKPYKLNFSITYWCQSRCLTCLRPDEPILGDNLPISEVKVGSEAIGSTGLKKVLQVFSRPYSGNMVRIKASGLLPIDVTPEHPILVSRSVTKRYHQRAREEKRYYRTYKFEEPRWREANQILAKNTSVDGDYLCTPIIKRTSEMDSFDLTPFVKKNAKNSMTARGLPLRFPLDEDMAWLLGIYTAEGCPSPSGAVFSFNAKETRLHGEIKRIAKKLGRSVTMTLRRNCASCRITSPVLARALVEWCGKGALNKKIPDFILLNKDDSILRAFIKGWEEGDAYQKNGVVIGSTVSKTLALQLQIAYASLSISANVSYVHKTKAMFYGKEINQHDIYIVKYSTNKRFKYSQKVGNYFLRPIRKLEKIPYKGTVHNIETEGNTYLVSNAVVHNCNIWQIRPKGELTIEEVREFAKKNTYFKWIELTGGEPFLRNDIVDIAKAFKEHSKELYILTLPTNSLCNHDMVEKKLREILSLGIPRVAITVSLDGYRELHDKIRGIPGNFDKCMDTFRRLRALKKEFPNLYFVFGYTLSKFNKGLFAKTVEEVQKEIPEVTYNDFHINLAQVSENYYGNQGDDIKARDKEVAAEIRAALAKRHFEISVIDAIEVAFLRRLADYAEKGVSPMRSRSLEASLFMDSFGNVYPSIMWNKKVGNVRDVAFDLAPLWGNDVAKQVREEQRTGKEPNQWTSCEAYQVLTGNVLSILT